MSELQLTAFGGRGPKAYFIHGFGADAQSWVANVPAVTDFAEAFAIDLPGHGRSSAVAVPASIEQMATQVLESIDLSSPCFFIGHSAGGAIAMLCAAQTQTLAVSLIAPAGLGGGINRGFTDALTNIQTDTEALTLLQSMVVNKRLISRSLAARLMGLLESDSLRDQWRCFAALLPDRSEDVLAARNSMPDTPVQVFWGLNDAINPLYKADQQRFSADWQLLDHCGHLPHIEHWSAYNAALVQMIKIRS